MIRVTVWTEHVQETDGSDYAKRILEVYPGGLHEALKGIFAECDDMTVTTATMDMPEYGLSEALLDNTDVLVYWAHVAHERLPDEIAQRVRQHVLRGMGFVPLHSAHPSKPLQMLLGSSGSLCWRDDDFCRVWTIAPSHPIAQGIPPYFELPEEEMYGEPFDIAKPDEIVFLSWFRSGNVFRSGCTWTRGYGRIFYFQPGHETNRAYYDQNVRRILQNAVRWVAPLSRRGEISCPHVDETPEQRWHKANQ